MWNRGTTVAILCPGPSLAQVSLLSHPDIVLAINYAMNAPFVIDWWVALDLWAFELPKRRPRAGMVTSSGAIAEGQAKRVPWPLIDFRQNPRAQGTATTLPAALWWADFLGAKHVRLYGCDMKGTSDFEGRGGGQRGEDRWALEKRECREVLAITGMECEGLPE